MQLRMMDGLGMYLYVPDVTDVPIQRVLHTLTRACTFAHYCRISEAGFLFFLEFFFFSSQDVSTWNDRNSASQVRIGKACRKFVHNGEIGGPARALELATLLGMYVFFQLLITPIKTFQPIGVVQELCGTPRKACSAVDKVSTPASYGHTLTHSHTKMSSHPCLIRTRTIASGFSC